MMVLTIRELDAPYDYVVSEQVVGDVLRLLKATSIALSVTGQEKRRSTLELEGLGQEIWEGVDPKKYIDELRDEWDNR